MTSTTDGTVRGTATGRLTGAPAAKHSYEAGVFDHVHVHEGRLRPLSAGTFVGQAVGSAGLHASLRPADLAREATAQELLRRGLDRDAVALALRTIRRDLDLDTSRPEGGIDVYNTYRR